MMPSASPGPVLTKSLPLRTQPQPRFHSSPNGLPGGLRETWRVTMSSLMAAKGGGFLAPLLPRTPPTSAWRIRSNWSGTWALALGVLSSTVPSTCAVNSRTIRASLAFIGPPGGWGGAPAGGGGGSWVGGPAAGRLDQDEPVALDEGDDVAAGAHHGGDVAQHVTAGVVVDVDVEDLLLGEVPGRAAGLPAVAVVELLVQHARAHERVGCGQGLVDAGDLEAVVAAAVADDVAGHAPQWVLEVGVAA